MYDDWKRGVFVLILSQLISLQAFGFKFPDGVKLKKLKKEKTNASNRFNPQEFLDFTPGREIQDTSLPTRPKKNCEQVSAVNQ